MTVDMLGDTRGAAIIDGPYRYRLERRLSGAGRTLAAIMVNPSTADAERDDQTVRKWIGFGLRHGVERVVIGNKFALRSRNVSALGRAIDPVGPQNDRHIEQIMRDADLHVVAWGTLNKLPDELRDRWREVAAIADRVGCPLYCLGTALDGHPLHPLTLSYQRPLIRWTRP